jgi:hypothetical protein
VLAITNVGDKPGKFTVQINYDGGPYVMGLTKINPGETKTFDLRQMRDQQTPDQNGHPLPPEMTTAQIRWSIRGDDSTRLIGRTEVVSVKDRVSTSYSCPVCCPNSFLDGFVTPLNPSTFIGDTVQFTAMERE